MYVSLDETSGVSLTPHPSSCAPGFFGNSAFQITTLKNKRHSRVFYKLWMFRIFALILQELHSNKLNFYLIPTKPMLYYKAMINDFSVVIRANKRVITSLQM